MGRLYIVGIGPGSRDLRTLRAQWVLERSRVIIGYNTYLGLITDVLGGKEVIGAGMGEELFRAGVAIRRALETRDDVALVSGGDPQVFGMAGLVLDLIARRGLELDVEVVPGVTAALAAAARLGSPLSLDFAVISLSDRLIPAGEILHRVARAAEADFVLALYNPINRDLLVEAMGVISRYRRGDTPVGIVRNAYRDGEWVVITTLSSWGEYVDEVDMSTTIIVGNSSTYRYGKYMITPRGYERKYGLWLR